MIVIRLSTLLACVFPLLSTDLAAGFGAATSRMRSGMTTTSTMPSAPPSMDAAVAHRQHDHHRQHPGGRRWPSSPPPHHLPSLSSSSSRKTTTALLSSSPPSEYGRSSSSEEEDDVNDDDDDDDEGDDYDDEMGPMSFQKELDRRGGNDVAAMDDDKNGDDAEEEDDEFDGYDLRDVICEKWGECFDVEFQKVDSYGFRSVYLNIMPFRLGGKRFRHETEYDYLCHLQAVVEILVKYEQLEYVLSQMSETTKKPRAGTSPLVAVPLRLDLTPEQVKKILR